MSSKIETLGVLFTLLFMTICLVLFGSRYYKNQTIVLAMQDSMKTSAYSNIDYSARVERKLFKLDKKQFESDLKESIKENSGLKDISSNINFKYTDEDINGYTGTKEIIVDFTQDKRQYVATIVVDKSKD